VIVYHKNSEIDRVKWDNCISNSSVTKPYPYSWYLDIMAPGWEALVDDDYNSVFPLPARQRFGIKYIATPVFLQQLGAFSPDKPPEIVIDEFLEYIPECYRLIDLCVSHPVSCKGFTVTEKANFELDLSSSYEILHGNFNRNCKRSIDQSKRFGPVLTKDVTSSELISLFRNNKGKEIKGVKDVDYKRLDNLINYSVSNKKGKILGVRSGTEELIFGLFYVYFKNRKTMIFLANTKESHEMRTGYYVYNELIKESAGSDTFFDFSGSSIPSIASFMQSFGSGNVPYYRIVSNRLLWPLSLLK